MLSAIWKQQKYHFAVKKKINDKKGEKNIALSFHKIVSPIYSSIFINFTKKKKQKQINVIANVISDIRLTTMLRTYKDILLITKKIQKYI